MTQAAQTEVLLSQRAPIFTDNEILFLGTDRDQAIVSLSAALAANTSRIGVLGGIPVAPALPPNSLVIASQTDDGDVLIAAKRSGNAEAYVHVDASAQTMDLMVSGVSKIQLGTGSMTLTEGMDIADDRLLRLGTGGDQVFVNRSTLLATNTALTNVLIGVPVTPEVSANSLILSNITASGDILVAGNLGGNSRAYLHADVSADTLSLLTAGVSRIFMGAAGLVGINETADGDVTIGLSINQGANDDAAFAIKSSDVAHGATTLAETDTYHRLSKREGAGGGLTFRALSDAQLGAGTETVLFAAYSGVAASTTKSTTGVGVIRLLSALVSGTGAADVGSDGNLVTIDNNGTTRFIFDAEGTLHSIGGTSTDTFGNGSITTGGALTITPTTDTIFADATGIVVGHTAQLALGNATAPELQMIGTAAPDTTQAFARFSADTGSPRIHLVKSRGATVATNTIVQNNDILGVVAGYAADAVDFLTNPAAIVFSVNDAAPAASDIGGRIAFWTSSGGGLDDIRPVGQFNADASLTLVGTLGLTGTRVSNIFTTSQTTTNAETVDSWGMTKKNIADYAQSALEVLRGVRVVTYEHKLDYDPSDRRKLGVLAETINDPLITPTDAYVGLGEGPRLDMLGLAALSVRGIQELMSEITILRQEVATLKGAN